MKISVVICTYNRAQMLVESIRAIINQNFPSNGFEIIIVDNNSSDNTKQIVEKFLPRSKVSIRYLFEGKQGLSFARNTGINAASGEIVAFVDDDIDAGNDWLTAVVEAFSSSHVACVGGPIRPIWLVEKPKWLTEQWYPFLSVSEFEAAKVSGDFIGPNYPWGANIAFRRLVLNELGGFPTNLGRIGKTLLSGEEVALCMKIEECGYRIAYAPNAIIYHKIPPERLTKRWFYKRTYWQGRSEAVLNSSNFVKMSAELRRHTSILTAGLNSGKPNSFNSRCCKRIGIGYVHQSLMGFYGGHKGKEYRALRALIEVLREASEGATALREQNAKLSAIENSISWRFSEPIRIAINYISRAIRRL